jgi:hypothetical protein
LFSVKKQLYLKKEFVVFRRQYQLWQVKSVFKN